MAKRTARFRELRSLILKQARGHLRPVLPVSTTKRQRVTKGAGSRQKGLLMAFKLLDMAERRWRRINAPQLVALVRAGGAFRDGVAVERRARARAA